MKTVLITGCEGQLGRACAAHLGRSGWRVIGFDLAPSSTMEEVRYLQVDITSQGRVRAAVEDLAAGGERVDALINNAGTAVFTPFEDRTEAEIDTVMDVNLKGTVLVTQAVFNRFFRPRRDGAILNIGSIYGVAAGDMRLYEEGDRRTPEIYGATKAAVIHLTRYWAAYMAPHGVRVNCLSPGGIRHRQTAGFIRRYEAKVPMGRMGEPEDLFSTLDYLIDERSRYVTGQNIVVDGGFTVW